ncbi:MAG: hypothetical protein WBO92_01365 [Candidatus Moraniibacteriota bacterium]
MSDTTKFPVDRLEVGATYEVSGNLMRLVAVQHNEEKGEFFLTLKWELPSGGYSTMSIGQFLAKNPCRVDTEAAA